MNYKNDLEPNVSNELTVAALIVKQTAVPTETLYRSLII